MTKEFEHKHELWQQRSDAGYIKYQYTQMDYLPSACFVAESYS